MIKVIFEAHSTTFDNEAGLGSGHNDVDLSPLGLTQCRELGARHQNTKLDAVYCSDLQRSYKTAALAFEGRFVPIYVDRRLRECDYGALTQQDANEIKKRRGERVTTPYPDGESYTQTCARMKSFLDDIVARHKDSDVIMVIGHRATQYGLEHALKDVSIQQAVTAPWAWQPGWEYCLATKG